MPSPYCKFSLFCPFCIHQLDESIKPQAHSDIINQLPNTYGKEVDVMVEAKHKELAIQPFIKESYEK